MDEIDYRLVQLTQSGLPLVSQPFAALALQLGLTEQQVIDRMMAMQQHGLIRRIAAVPNHYRLGYRHNGMTVWDVDDSQIDVLGQQIGALSFVSHCYQRPRHLPAWPYNLFAMVHGKTREETTQQIAVIRTVLGDACRGSDTLYSTRILKKTGLRLPE
ncbi:DNA-binding Lrp family transcriptional regulator [Chitinivorax tropicus]|uniref:siroheme decarboxylase n=1 Tax=Chitinivorax tropicus TaxID=714531 RepID=A0A840MLY1_9PROT|nr:AsnC family transcriptional regulator [Chitinivorax tropicus]MBB5018139.1 DNA-binding Lrp family transcriptional regulator [Chitinivorax tropicus]